VRQAIDMALLFIIGCANKTVYSASRGRVVLYRFRGGLGALLTVTGPAASVGEIVVVGYLPDGDDYIVLPPRPRPALRPLCALPLPRLSNWRTSRYRLTSPC
jgi:hypothetical protein